MDAFQLNSRCIDDARPTWVVEVHGYVDTQTSLVLEKELRHHLHEGHHHLLLDLSEVDYISSAGWGIFIAVVRPLREKGGDLKLVGMQRDVIDVFELLEFQTLLEAHADVETALSAVGQR